MSFVNKAKQEHSIEFTRNIYLDSFSIQNKRLVFTCECGETADCIGMIYETLFPLNALCDSRFHSFVYAIESRLVSMWTDNFTNVIPILLEDSIISFKFLGDIISDNFITSYFSSHLFQELNLKLDLDSEDCPLVLYNGLTKTSYSCKFPLASYYEKGMKGLTYQCKKCLVSTNFDSAGNQQLLEL